MKTQMVIQPHNGVHKPDVRTVTFFNHGKSGLGTPARYSTDAKTDGSVTLREYDNLREYRTHLSKLKKAIRKFNARN